MKSIIATLSPQTIETLISWCEQDTYKEVRKRCAKPKSEGGLDLQISESTLNRLCASHGIADSAEARKEYIALLNRGPNVNLLDVSYENLELRLFELSARPNPSQSELRLIFQIVTRLRALKISERRVQIAEQREARLAAKTPEPETPKEPAPQKPKQISDEETARRVRVLLGKEPLDDPESPDPQPQPQPSPKLMSVAEMQYRVRRMLGKEP